MSFVNVAVGASKAITALSQGGADLASAKNQQTSLNYSAQQEEQAGLDMARVIRRAGARARGEATAGYAGAGVKVDSGSAELVANEITTDSTQDAWTAILDSKRRANALRTQGSMARIQGDLAMSNARAGAVSSVLESGYKGAMSGWATYNYNGDAGGMNYSRSGADIRARR